MTLDGTKVQSRVISFFSYFLTRTTDGRPYGIEGECRLYPRRVILEQAPHRDSSLRSRMTTMGRAVKNLGGEFKRHGRTNFPQGSLREGAPRSGGGACGQNEICTKRIVAHSPSVRLRLPPPSRREATFAPTGLRGSSSCKIS